MKAVIYKNHTLGLLADNGIMEILSAMTTKGAPFSLHDDPIIVNKSDCRPATVADFKEYRVLYHPSYNAA